MWLLISLPASFISYFAAQHIIKRRVAWILNNTRLTGAPRNDYEHMMTLAGKTFFTEIRHNAETIAEYCSRLMQSEEYKRHSILFQECSSAIIVCDLDGRILEWNQQLSTLLGDIKPTLYGTPIKELFCPRDQLTIVTGMAHVRQPNRPASSPRPGAFSARIRLNSSRKRSQHVETVIKRIVLGDRPSLVVMLHNVTHQVSAERGLEHAKDAALLQMQDRHKFYKGLTEELEPLAEALDQSIIMLSETSPTKDQQRHMDNLQLHNELLSELLSNIREFALWETGEIHFERTHFELETLLKQVHAATYSRAMQFNSDICFYLDPLVPQEAWFDFSKSLKTLSNLVNLVVRRTHGGIVTITARIGPQQNGNITVIF